MMRPQLRSPTLSTLVSLTTVLALAWLLCANPARAYHEDKNRSIEETAYVLKHGEWLLGPLQLGVGIWRFQLSTRVAPWILGATLGKALPNLSLDLLALEKRDVTLTLRSSLYYVNSRKLIEGDDLIRLFVIPVGTSLSWQINENHTVSTHFRYVRVISDADAQEDDLKVKGGAVADNFQISTSWMMRLTPVSAVILAMRYLPYQGDPIIESDARLDDRTTAEVEAELNKDDMQHSLAASVFGAFSWKHFNLAAGLTYGALFLAGPGLVLPLRYPYPEVRLYWRLGGSKDEVEAKDQKKKVEAPPQY